MENISIFKYLPVSVYISKVKIYKEDYEIIEFKLLHKVGLTKFDEDELKPKTILSSFDKNELTSIINSIKKLSINDTFTLIYRFKDKDGKILFLKDYIRVLEIKDNVYTLLGVVTDISKEAELSEIFETLLKSPNIGIVIYKEKIILADETLKKWLEIGEEIYDFSPIDFLTEKFKEIVNNNIKLRLEGKKFSKFHFLELININNKRLYVEAFAETIFFDGGYAGVSFLINKTNMLNMDLIVNSLINQINDEDELLKEIYKNLKKFDYFADIKMNEKLDKKEIIVDNNYNNLKSFLYLPIVVDGKITASFSFYSQYRDDFDNDMITTFKEIQKKIILALKNIQNQKNLLILKNAIDRSYQWVIITDKDGKIIYVNDAVEEISKYKKEELIGKNPNIFKSNLNEKNFYKNLWDTILRGKIFNGIFINRSKEGKLFYLKSKIIPVKIGNEMYFVALGVDITKEKLLERELNSIKYKDVLTGLYNRHGFIFYAQNKLKGNKNYALLLIDIEDFKFLNEFKGFKYGDFILEEFGKFLREIFYNNDLIARVGNDDFAVLVEFNNLRTFFSIIHKFEEKLKQKQQELPINVNIGIAIYPKDAENIEELIEKAYIALTFSKKFEQNSYKLYNKDISNEIEKYMEVKRLVSKAIEKNQFIYFFQPYVDSVNFNIQGVESLIRIKKENEIITPNVFIDYAERSGIIKKIEILMMQQLVKNIEELQLSVSFNLSGFSLQDEEHIQRLIDISKNYSEFITIEITERELIENLKYTQNILELFKQEDYKIAIDDFGTGYSSLSYISNLPIDILKIDISFIKDMDINEKNLAIVDTIISFAKKLNLKTVAEGVEREKQIKILKDLGCDYLQGFYFYKPIPICELKRII